MGSVFPLILMLLPLTSLALPSTIQTFPSTVDTTVINVRSARLLDLTIRDYTVQFLHNKKFKTGVVKNIDLPANLTGIKVDTVKFRCGSLSKYGGRIKDFYLRKGVIISPCVQRVILIRQNLGLNWSTKYFNGYNLQGYELVTPILGLFAYNGGEDYQNTSRPDPFEVQIFANQDPIKVDFTNFTRGNPKISIGKMPYCAIFEGQGKLTLTSMVSPNVCEAKKQGHIGLVIEATGPTPPAQYAEGISRWKIALGSSIGAALGAFLLGLLLIAMFVKAKKRSKLEEMERRAYEEEALEVTMVGHVKAPTSPVTRIVPRIEHVYKSSYF